jgi:PPM family protein phosphatase
VALGEVTVVRTASRSDVGRARGDNQDAHGEFLGPFGERLLVVADGMGGHAGGATASRICVETLGAALAESAARPRRCLERALAAANARILDAAELRPELAGMGTTAVALLFPGDDRAWLAWVGDSRAYRARGSEFEALSADHSVVAEWVRTGILRPEEAEKHPRRNELLRALGAAKRLEPEVRELEVRDGDRFLLCTDGLSGVVPEAEIAAVVTSEEPELAAKKLVAMANERGGPDNVTVVIAVASFGGEPRPRRRRGVRGFLRQLLREVTRRRG